MDPQAIWIIILSIATPVAGVIGFAVQLRQVKKSRLENEKLQLEIEALRANASLSEKRIMQVTTAEVERFARSDIMFSRAPVASRSSQPAPSVVTWKGYITTAVVAVFGILLFVYAAYDLYRALVWLMAKL